MTPSDIAAWLGAAAWIPQIFYGVYRLAVKPRVALVTGPNIKIGSSLLGPSIELNCAISASRCDALIRRITISVRHEKGQAAQFLWLNLNETFSQIRNVSGETAEIGRSQPALALKVGPSALVEKSISFLDERLQTAQSELIAPLVETRNHLQKTYPEDYQDRTLKSKEFANVIDFFKKSAFWQQGRYDLTIQTHAVGVKTPFETKCQFDLLSTEIDRLNRNFPEIEREFTALISPPREPKPILYDWITKNLRR